MERTFTRLSALDAFFLASEHEGNPMHIGAACLFEDYSKEGPAVTLKRLRDHIEARLDSIPRYRQRLIHVPLEGHPVWTDCPDFRVADHVRAVRLPESASAADLEETLSWIFSQPLVRSRPLWEIWLIDGLAGGGFALACKTHHCLTDGLGGSALLSAILGTEPFTVTDEPGTWTPRAMPGAADLLRSALEARWEGLSRVARSAAAAVLSSPRSALDGAADFASALGTIATAAWRTPATTVFDDPAGSDRRYLWWSLPLGDVQRIGRRLGGTVNDVALALVSEALVRTSAVSAGDRSLRVYCPVGAAAPGFSTTTLGNHVSGMIVDLPAEARDLRERWQRVVAATRACKESGATKGTFLLSDLADAMSPALLSRLDTLVGGSKLFNLILTNVPGPQVPLYLFRHRMTSVCPLVPLFRGQGLAVAIFSYDGRLTWGFHVDASRVAEARQLRSALAAATIRLARLANERVSESARLTVRAIPFPTMPRTMEERAGNVASAAG